MSVSLCLDPVPFELQDKIRITLSCLGGLLQIHGDVEPSPIVLGELATTEKKNKQRFPQIATTLDDLNAKGLDAQTVNDLLTMYVGAASQHVLRMSFVPEKEAQNFDMQVTAFWSHLSQRDVISPLFFEPLKLGELGVGSAVQRHAAAPWRAWQSVSPTLMATTRSPDTDTFFNTAPRLRAHLVQLQTTLSLQMNKPAFLLKPLGAAIRQKATQKKRVATTIQRYFHKQQLERLTATPVDRAVLLSQSTAHTRAHLMQPSSEAYEAEDRCFRVAVVRRLMLPYSAAPNAADVAPILLQQKRSGSDLYQTCGSTAAPLPWRQVRRWRRPQACCSGQMPGRCDTLTQGHQGVH